MKRFLLAPAIAGLLLVSTACGEDSDASGPDTPEAPGTPTPTETPADESPTPAPVPGLFVVDPASGDGVAATAGTRCWADKCIDYIGPVTNVDPVEFDAGANLAWQAEGGTVETISHAWVSAEEVESEVTSEGTRVWRIGGDFEEGDIVVPSEPGEYVLLIFTRYTTGDDVSWGVYVSVP